MIHLSIVSAVIVTTAISTAYFGIVVGCVIGLIAEHVIGMAAYAAFAKN